MKRRTLLGLLGGGATWPLVARAQSSDRIRRIGMILPAAADDPEYQTWVGAFLRALAQSDWTIGRNIRLDIHWATPDPNSIRKHAAELAALAPDIIVAAGTSTVGPVLQATRAVPVVFPTVVDPVGAGFVDSLARPGGNATGFLLYEYSLSGKWLGLLKQVAPGVTRVAVLRDPTTPSGSGQFAAIQSAAASLNVEIIPINLHDPAEIESGITAFARLPNGGMVLTGSGPSILYHDPIIKLAAQNKLPTIYYERFYAAAGGLISYGADRIDLYRRAAGYVDRILKGQKPADLPVQAPDEIRADHQSQDC